jgi:hypothetical protein
MPDKTYQKRRTNRVFKSLHMPLTYLGADGNTGRDVIQGGETRNEVEMSAETETMTVETRATPEITRAAERYLEQYGDPLVMNTYLKVTILVLAVVCLILAGLTLQKPESSRVDAPRDCANQRRGPR